MNSKTLYAIPLIASAISASSISAVANETALSVISATSITADTEVVNEEILNAIEANALSWTYAYEKGDIEALSGLYTEDSVILPPTGSIIEKTGIETFWSEQMENKLTDLTIEPINVQVNDDEVYVAAVWSANINGEAVSGQSVKVLEKTSNGFLKTKVQTWK